MKKVVFAASFALLTTACGNNPENNASSTPIDSSNVHGTPGAQYGPDNPAAANAPKYEGSTDTGLRANTVSSEDSLQNRK